MPESRPAFPKLPLALGFAASLALLYALAGLRDRFVAAASLAVALGAGAIARFAPAPWPGASAALLALAVFAFGAALEAGAVLAGALALAPGEMLAALDAELVIALWWARRSPLERALVPATAVLAVLSARVALSGRRR